MPDVGWFLQNMCGAVQIVQNTLEPMMMLRKQLVSSKTHMHVCYDSCGLQAVGEGDLQRVMQVASTMLSAWMPAHLPDLLLEHPSGPAILQQPLAHLGCSQVQEAST